MSDRPAVAPVRLRWRTRAIGWLLPLFAVSAILLGIAAFRPSLVDELASGRRGAWIEWTSAVTVVGVNLPLALVTLWLTWETFRFAWRWADEVAITITDAGLVPHGSLHMRSIAWAAITDVRFVKLPGGRALAPSLLIDLRDGSSLTIRGVDNEEGAAEHFVEAARVRLREATT